ncbi:MAG: 4-alpha-glucanotransferase [Myxococcaceae bacterium]|nr:4-alpha-glucanotransferase [Myxococcaceae bacterium]
MSLPQGRTSGIMLPLFSFRSSTDAGIGDFGSFGPLFKWMQAAKQRLLMVLPLLPTAPGDPSPYSTRSAFGFNPLFIDLRQLEGATDFSADERASLELARAAPTVQYDRVFPLKEAALARAFARFEKKGDHAALDRFRIEQSDWLETFALFAVISDLQQHKAWWEWPEPLAKRHPAALDEVKHQHERAIRYQAWLQWVADAQWKRVRDEAKAHGMLLCGDEPFIIGKDSADAWAFPHLLRIEGRLGVPPDDFAADGQDWGLPWFDFDAMEREGYQWLRRRARAAAAAFDVRRVDHAIGYFRQYIRDAQTPRGRFIPSHEPQQQALGEKHFRLLSEGAGIVAEDLGVMTPFVRKTLDMLELPGYRVMRWAREDGVYANPRQYPAISLATTGTHDTETLREWWQSAPQWEREACCRTFPELHKFFPPGAGWSPELLEAMIAAAENASSNLCVIPWGDLYGETTRVNLPGSIGPHNWSYRMRQNVESLMTHDETVAGAQLLARLTMAGGRG